MLYHEMIIFVDRAAIPCAGPGDDRLQASWQMYAARTRACDLSNLDHAFFRSVDGDKSDAGDPEEWQNCLQWDALMTRVLNAAYMRRTREAVIQRWDADTRQYWRRVEGLSEARVDRVAKAVLTYGLESPVEVAASESSGSEVDRGIQNGPNLACHGDSEQEDGELEDELEGVVNPSSCSPELECEWDEATNDRGAEVNDVLYEFDFEEELRGGYSDVGLGHDLEFKCDGGFGPEFGFESLDSVLSDATPPPASLTPSSSEASSADMDSECILYPRLMPTSIPTSHPGQGQTQFLARPRLAPRMAIYPAVTEESPSSATSSSSDRTVHDFSAFSLSLSTKTGMNVRDNRLPLSSNPRAASGFTSQSQPAPARPYGPSLLDLALALGTRGSEERLRKRELTSSSSYPSPPPSPLPQPSEDRYPQVPQDTGESTVRNTICIHPNDSTPTSGSFNPTEGLTHDSSWTRMDLSPPASAPPASSKKLRVMLNLTFKNPAPCDPPTTTASVPADPESVIPRTRTAFSLLDAIIHPQGAPTIHPSGRRSAGAVDMQSGDLDCEPNFQVIHSMTVDCERKAACLRAQSLHGLVGVCSQGTDVGAGESLDQSDGERKLVAGGDGGTTRRRGEKARRQGERKHIRIEVTQARDTE